MSVEQLALEITKIICANDPNIIGKSPFHCDKTATVIDIYFDALKKLTGWKVVREDEE